MQPFRFKWLLRHLYVVLKHKWFVAVAGRQTGVSWWQIFIHDWSKLLPSEAFAYARNFNGTKDDPDGFAAAWLHHQNYCQHHWEHWLIRSGRGVKTGCGITLKMPEKYIREMVCDWMAASRAYTGSWDMTQWLRENFNEKIILHSESRKIARELLYELGYDSSLLRSPPVIKI